jgi:hypothetical protein
MIKRYLKEAYLVTSLFVNTSVSLLSVLFFSSFRVSRVMRECERKHKKSNECVVMGNGPSITTLFEKQRSHLANKDIFAVNYFCLTDYFDLVKPKFYVMLDPAMFAVVVHGSGNRQAEELIVKFNDITWEMVVFVPAQYKKSKLTAALTNNKLSIIPFNSTPINNGIVFVENLLFKSNLGMPFPQTVINAVIFLAINLKYDIVNLYGVEQSWLQHLHVTNDNQVNVGLPHFYTGPSDLGRHSTLNTLSTFLFTQAVCFASHMRLEEYARYKGLQVLNHTPGSYIDAYKRVVDEQNAG